VAILSTYVLLPGAGSDSSYWYLVAPELRQLGHEVITPDLPVADDAAGLPEYAAAAVAAIGDRRGVILVAQSMAGFTAPLVCQQVPVALLVLVNAMVPRPGETPGEWWGNTGHAAAQRSADLAAGRPVDGDFDVLTTFLHDVPADVLTEVMAHELPGQSDTPFATPCLFSAWPDVVTRYLLCRDDRFFPADFQRRMVAERLGITPAEMDGGHLPALARPHELVLRLEGFRAGIE
jgi:pimeloyl-ACP methyl ester carboxylesterase